MKLEKIKSIKGKIRVLTGLHIGAGNENVEIGGQDNPVIKNPLTGEPYIPGSSIKGKMRSLMEWKLGKITNNNGEPCQCGDCDVCKVFGVGVSSKKNSPTRIIVSDAFLTEEWKKRFNDGEDLFELKYENSINRITAKANPRNIERVVPGVEFEFNLSFKIFKDKDKDNNINDEDLFNNVVLAALKLIEEYDYLGGGGSRGNGKIKFIDLKNEEGKDIKL